MHLFPLLVVFVGGEVVDMISNSGPIAKLILLSLLAFSVISWALILSKWSLLKRARTQSGRFVRAFRKAQRLQDVGAVAEQFRPSPLVGVFEGASRSSAGRAEFRAGWCTIRWRFSAPCRSPIPRNSPASSATCRGWPSPARSLPLSDCSE